MHNPENGTEPGQSNTIPTENQQQAFTNNIATPFCTDKQTEKIKRAGQILSDRIYENQGWSFMNCLGDSFISRAADNLWSSEIWPQLVYSGVTEITCADSISSSSCGGGYDWWGCAHLGVGGGAEKLLLSNILLNDPNNSDEMVAGVIAHELTHNRSHSHPKIDDPEYDLTVCERVRSCVEHGNVLPLGQSRTSGMKGRVFLGPVGRMGGTLATRMRCNSDFFNGLTVSGNSVVDGMVQTCASGSGPMSYVGSGFTTKAKHVCDTDELMVGIIGKAGQVVDSLQVVCGKKSDLNKRRYLTKVGGAGGRAYERICPNGMAVMGANIRSGKSIDQIQLLCDHPNSNRRNDTNDYYTPFIASTTPVNLDCSGYGAITAIVGRSGARIDRISAICEGTNAGKPLQKEGPVHTLAPFVGGTGGNSFSVACPDDQLMIGIEKYINSTLNAVKPICAPFRLWDENSDQNSRNYSLPFHGTQSGNKQSAYCSDFQFVTGLTVHLSSSTIKDVSIKCNELRRITPRLTGNIYSENNLCIEVSGSRVQLGSCASNLDTPSDWLLHRRWDVQIDSTRTIRALGKCLDIQWGGTANGTDVHLWDCDGSAAQEWQWYGTKSIRNPMSGRCLDVKNGDLNNGVGLQIWDCNDTNAQKFSVQKQS